MVYENKQGKLRLVDDKRLTNALEAVQDAISGEGCPRDYTTRLCLDNERPGKGVLQLIMSKSSRKYQCRL